MRRRGFLGAAGAAGMAALVQGCAGGRAAGERRQVVVVGGGFGGTIAARVVRRMDPSIDVTLIERDARHVCCPFSNHVLAGLKGLDDITVGYEALAARHGIRVIHDEVIAIDPDEREVTTRRTGAIAYDRLILSPGIDFRFEELDGYDPVVTPTELPHAWKAGEQTLLLKRQIEAMPDGGSVLITVPPTPFRCPPGPYERACLVAAYLKRAKPRSKVVVLDANPEIVSLGAHFKKAWDSRFGGMIDHHPAMQVSRVDAKAKTVFVEGFVPFSADVVNLVPPQRAGLVAARAGLAGGRHWCEVDPDTFESRVHPGIHVIGDAAGGGAMPKSGTSANAQAKACAVNVVALLNGARPVAFSGLNVCYTALDDKVAASVAAVYRSAGGEIVAVPGAGGASPLDLSDGVLEHAYAEGWLRNIMAEMTG